MVRPDHSLKHDLNLHVGVVGEFVLAERLWDLVIDRLGLEVLVHVEIFDTLSSSIAAAPRWSCLLSFTVCVKFRFWVRKVATWGSREKCGGIWTSENWFFLGCDVVSSACYGEVTGAGCHESGMLDDGRTWSSRCIFDKTLQVEVFGLNYGAFVEHPPRVCRQHVLSLFFVWFLFLFNSSLSFYLFSSQDV